jgi:3-hydroxyisobutyrate dehydrogenase
MKRVAFIGLGNMAAAWPRTSPKRGTRSSLRPFGAALSKAEERGCKRATSAAEAVIDVDAVITMLPAGKHVREVYEGSVIGKAPTSAILIDCSTIDVTTARDEIAKAKEQGYDMVDAPVSGGIAAAEGGTLTFMVGGMEAAFKEAKTYLDKMGKA